MKILNKIASVFAPVSLGLLFFGTSCEKKAEQTLPNRKYELTWSDEFNDSLGTSPDSTRWTYDIGTGNNGWGNAELQYYTNRPANVKMDGTGHLVITARNESFAGSAYTSARIKTKGRFTQTYGRMEARIKTPTGPGIWPAFWMLGANIDEVPWPQCGEIDIMEQRGQEPNITHGSLHGPGYSGGNAKTKAYALANGRFDNDFHIYAVEWGVGYVDFFVDNFLYQRITSKDVTGEWVYNHPFFLIMNVAVGGNFVGFPTSGTPFPQSMLVDYVRVFREK